MYLKVLITIGNSIYLGNIGLLGNHGLTVKRHCNKWMEATDKVGFMSNDEKTEWVDKSRLNLYGNSSWRELLEEIKINILKRRCSKENKYWISKLYFNSIMYAKYFFFLHNWQQKFLLSFSIKNPYYNRKLCIFLEKRYK